MRGFPRFVSAGFIVGSASGQQVLREGGASIAGGTDEVMPGIICKLEGTVPKAGHGA